MKRFIFSLILLPLALATYCQPAPATPLTKEDYLQKSKNQKKTGLILLIGGSTMAIIGGIVFANSDFLSSDDPSTDAGGYLFIGGLTLDLVSIPFFISSSNNARKAASIGFSNQRLLLPQQNQSIAKMQPSLTLRIAF